jgi:ABC-type sugar transport system ATPase subunit
LRSGLLEMARVKNRMDDFIALQHISKSFSRNRVLNDISLTFKKGQIHSIVGENGAGKSTLIKIIGGVYDADEGEMYQKGQQVEIDNPNDAFDHGIGIIHQELSVFRNMTVAHNVFPNREPINSFGFIDWKKMNAMATEEFMKIGIQIDPQMKVRDLSVGMQQIVEIVKILSFNAEMLIMDEPTSALSAQETKILFDLLLKLRDQGTSIVFVSHRLAEVLYLSDQISILRDGNLVGTMSREEATEDKIIHMMVGRVIDQLYPPKAETHSEEKILEVRNLSRTKKFLDISFDLHRGEILGLFGLIGSGRTELAYSIIGADKIDSGGVFLEGRRLSLRSPRAAVQQGLCYLTEDRRNFGLFLNMSVKNNLVSSIIDSITDRFGMIRSRSSRQVSETFIDLLDVNPQDPEKQVEFLSGGNQQKILLGKWLATQPKVLIVDEPTRGVDVGAKAKLHNELRRLADDGIAILMISSDLPEVLGVCDRVMVMHEGRQKGILENHEPLEEETVMSLAFKEN